MHEVALFLRGKSLLRKRILRKAVVCCWLGFSSMGSTQIPSSREVPSQVEPAFPRVSMPLRGELTVSIPLVPPVEEVSFSAFEVRQLKDRLLFNLGPYPFPELQEGGEGSFPRWRELTGSFPTQPIHEKGISMYYSPPIIQFPPEHPSTLAATPSLPSSQLKVIPPKEDPVKQVPAKEREMKETPKKEEPKAPSAKPEESSQVVAKSPSQDSLPNKKVEGEVGKTVRIVLPGIGWIYLGEKDPRGKVKYLGKDTGSDSTTFTFSVIQEGDAVLQFQQQDLLAKSIVYDSVLVTTSRASKQVPGEKKDGKDPLEAPTRVEATPSATNAALTTMPEEPFPLKVDRFINEGKKKEAVQLIEEYLLSEEGKETREKDRWYFTLAQMYEGEGEVKDMKKALFYYERVRDQFPFSPYWEEADYKSRYIRRNFFEIR